MLMENNDKYAIVRYIIVPFIHKQHGTLYDIIGCYMTCHTNI